MAHERLLLVARRLSLALGCHFRCGSDSPLMLHLLSYDALLVSLAPHAARASKLGAQANALADAAQARRAARRLQPGGADQTLHVARDDIGRAADRWIPPQAELALAAAAQTSLWELYGLLSSEEESQRGQSASSLLVTVRRFG